MAVFLISASPDGKTESLEVVVSPVGQDKSLLAIHKKGVPKAIVVKAVYERKGE